MTYGRTNGGVLICAVLAVALLSLHCKGELLRGTGVSGRDMLVARYGERHVVVRGRERVAYAEFMCTEHKSCGNPHMFLWASDAFSEAEQAFAIGLAEGSLTASHSLAHLEQLYVPALSEEQRADLVARVQALEARSLAEMETSPHAREIVLLLEQLRGLWRGFAQNRREDMPELSEEDMLVLQFGEEFLRGTHAEYEERDEFDEEWGCIDVPPLRFGCVGMLPMAEYMVDTFAAHAALPAGGPKDEFGRIRHLARAGEGIADEVYYVAPVLRIVPYENLLVLSSNGLAMVSTGLCGFVPSSSEWVPVAMRTMVAAATAGNAAEFRDALAVGADNDRAHWAIIDMKRVSRYREPEEGFLSVVEFDDSSTPLEMVVADMSHCQERPIVSHNVGFVGTPDDEHNVWVRVGDELLDPIAQWFYLDCALWRHNLGPSSPRCMAGYRSFNYTTLPPRETTYRHILDRVNGKFFISDEIMFGAAWSAFMRHGWTRVGDPFEADAIWRRGILPTFDHSVKRRHQLYNTIDNHVQLTTKGRLNRNLKEYDERVGTEEYPHLAASQMQPETFVIYMQEDCERFFRLMHENTDMRNQIWIKKATSLASGDGMYVLDGAKTDWAALQREQYTGHISTSCRQSPIRESDGEKYIVQRYITNPLLIKGRKMELRAYWTILSLNPLLVVFREGGSLRNIQPWEYGDWENKKRHVSNTAQQGVGEGKNHESLQTAESSLKWGWDRVENYFVENGVMEPGFFHGTLVPLMKEYVVRSVNATRHKLRKQHGVFQLFRSDYMMDDNLHPWMSEVQLNPGKSTKDPVKRDLIPHLMDETLNLVVEVNARKENGDSLVHLHNMDGYEWLINEAANYVYRAP